MTREDLQRQLVRKQAELRQWLDEQAAGIEREQRHLQEGSPERRYWHYGYYVALNDVRALLAGRN